MTSQALDVACRRLAASKGSLQPMWRAAPAPSGAGGAARRGEITSAQTGAVGKGWGAMLKDNPESIQRRDLEDR